MKKIIILFLMFLITLSLAGCFLSAEKSSEKTEIDWDSLILKEKIPVPDTLIGEVGSNLEHALIISLYDVTDEQYKTYVQLCIDKGYNIETDENETFYTAFNSEGYQIRLVFQSDKQLNIFLEAPEEMTEFEWPITGLGKEIPETQSTYGRICWDNEESFIVHVGHTSIEDMLNYINACKESGYNIDIKEDDTFFNAYNMAGNELQIMYLGYNNIEISLKISEHTNISDDSTEASENELDNILESNSNTDNESQNNSASESETENNDLILQNNQTNVEDVNLINGMRKEFKDAMDDYEAFFDEYVLFMKKYNDASDVSTLMLDYAELMSKYEQYTESFEEWENEELNDTELAYYLQVQTRVTEKLLSIQ